MIDWRDIATGFAGVVGTLSAALYSAVNAKIERKADLVTVDAINKRVEQHQAELGQWFSRLHDHIVDEDAKFAKLFEAIHTNHAEILRELGKKMDR